MKICIVNGRFFLNFLPNLKVEGFQLIISQSDIYFQPKWWLERFETTIETKHFISYFESKLKKLNTL